MKIIEMPYNENCPVRQEAIENLKKSKRFIGVFEDEEGVYQYCAIGVHHEQAAYMLNLILHKILEKEEL